MSTDFNGFIFVLFIFFNLSVSSSFILFLVSIIEFLTTSSLSEYGAFLAFNGYFIAYHKRNYRNNYSQNHDWIYNVRNFIIYIVRIHSTNEN